MTSLLVLIDRLLTIILVASTGFGWCLFDGVCVHCAVHDQHGLMGSLFFGGLWVGLLSGYIVSLTWVSSLFLGCCLFGCVGGFSEGVTPSILSEPGS